MWNELDTASWKPVVDIGPNWFGKWTFNSRGYWIILTGKVYEYEISFESFLIIKTNYYFLDGITLWGEQRDAKYVSSMAEVIILSTKSSLNKRIY